MADLDYKLMMLINKKILITYEINFGNCKTNDGIKKLQLVEQEIDNYKKTKIRKEKMLLSN